MKRQDVLLDNLEVLELRNSILPVRDMSNWTISIPKVAFNHHGSKEVIYLTDNFDLQKPHVYSINRLISANHSRSIKLEIGTEERSMSYKDLENAKQPRVLYCMTETPEVPVSLS